MKFSLDFQRIMTFIKENPEKIVFWILLTTFIYLGIYLTITWQRKPLSFLDFEEMAIKGTGRESATEAAVLADLGGLLTGKPITYYSDFVQRNPFSRLPVNLARILEGDDDGNDRRPPPPLPGLGLIYRGQVEVDGELVAFIEGKKTYPAREGDEVEGWKVLKIEKDKVILYDEEMRKEVILPLGGGPEEKERLRRRSEERRELGENKEYQRRGEPSSSPGRRRRSGDSTF